jgi:hypothetical protein
MERHKEIDAMKAVADALEPLDEEAVRRVLAWAASSHGVSGSTDTRRAGGLGGLVDTNAAVTEFQHFSDLFDTASPATNPDRALVAGYWLQVVDGQEDFVSQDANDLLRDLGHGAKNITDAFNKLQAKKPVLARQVQKGSGKMGRKRIRLTQAGIKRVEALVSGEAHEDAD